MTISSMKRQFIIYLSCLAVALSFIQPTKAQGITKSTRAKIGAYLTYVASAEVNVKRIDVQSAKLVGNTLKLYASTNLSYIPFREEGVEEIYRQVKELLPANYKKYRVEIITDTQKIEDLVPSNRNKKDFFTNKLTKPLLTNLSKPYKIERGLLNHHLALWQSHGWYYEQKLGRWEWQRARIFQTVEDLFTQSFVLPYLLPMLENAGANVLIPRERDSQSQEVIVDNDSNSDNSLYREKNAKEKWTTGKGKGFANPKIMYLEKENPFAMGSFRQTETVDLDAKPSVCEWVPDIPQKGTYGVYISYKSFANSTDDARYTVYHSGGKTEFSINQKMGGGTWIFLGFFLFDEGVSEGCRVTLSNQSRHDGNIITADAVKIGGGMGNIARRPHPAGLVTNNTKSSANPDTASWQLPAVEYQPEVSGYPRYAEAARYWMQWAGIPDTIYSRNESKNDYMDDYQSRGHWVNYISGGSSVSPHREGLHIPIDLAMAFHSDAGTTSNDSIIGTLGICMTHSNNKRFENGKSRWTSRDLTDMIMSEIVSDIRREYEPNWTRRYIFNKSYSEANVPNVPTMLLELLSHQNFADMKYGLDPRFRFTVGRSVYKGMLKFVAQQYDYDYVVQPLPVRAFGMEFAAEGKVTLKWSPVPDVSEPTAKPDKYIVYTRIDDGGFDNGTIVKDTIVSLPIQKDRIYSYKIAAVNKGGESFPSEILSACRKSDEKGVVLIINGFDRLSAPYSFDMGNGIGGFYDMIDHGVPDKSEYHYTGSQYEFRRTVPWMDDDAAGFGASHANYETTVVAGNTFDYPAMHGRSISRAGYSFISTSRDAVIEGRTSILPYPMIDLILGKQKQTTIGRGTNPPEFKTFPKPLQDKIIEYCKQGGNIFVSGAYVASDIWETEKAQTEDQSFATDVLKYKWRIGQAAVTGRVKGVASPFRSLSGNYEFYTVPNSFSYNVESPDAIEPVGENSFTVFRYSENNLSAGVAYRGTYRTCIMGFPFEVIKNEEHRDNMIKGILTLMFDK